MDTPRTFNHYDMDETTDLTELYPEVIPYVNQCPPAMILEQLRKAAQRFCNDTCMWTTELQPISILEGVTTYDLELWDYDFARIRRVLVVSQNDQEMRCGDGTEEFRMQKRTRLVLGTEPAEDSADALDVVVELEPSNDATELPTELVDEWGKAIGECAKWLIMSQAGKPWFNADGAALAAGNYRQMVSRAKEELARNHTNTDLRVDLNYYRW